MTKTRSFINSLTKGKYTGVILWRVIVSFLVTFGTYNPWSDFSFVGWLNRLDSPGSGALLAASIIFAIHLAFIVASVKALGRLGSSVSLIVIACAVFFAFDKGVFSPDSNTHLRSISLLIYTLFLTIGLSSAIIWRRATGQVATRDISSADEEPR